MATTKPKKEYASNSEMLAAWHEANELGVLTPRLAKFIMLLCERYSYHPWFAGYSFREDMVNEAVVNLCANWRKFNPTKQERPNIFAYFTTAAYRSFLKVMDQERTQRTIRDELLMEEGFSPSWNYNVNAANAHGGAVHDSDTHSFGAHHEA